jgi:hypothetical protein
MSPTKMPIVAKRLPFKMSPFITLVPGPDLFTSGLFLGLKLGLPVGLGGAGGPIRPHVGLTQLAIPILTPKIGLGDESGPDIRWWESRVITPG